MPSELACHELVTLALYLLGGDCKPVDTEDVGVKVNEMAPGRFVWKKYPEQINLELVRVALSDAKKLGKGEYVIGSGNHGWLLTAKGLRFARRGISAVPKALTPRNRRSPREMNLRRSERARLLTDPAFLKFEENGIDSVSSRDAEAFFRVDDYVTGMARQQKVLRAVNMFGNDPELGSAVRHLAAKVRKGA